MTIPAAASALRFAATQSEPANHAWLAVGLTTALKASLMEALSAYENAEPEDILDTDRKGAASIRLLLRRAISPDYLSEHHRLPLTSSKRKAVLKLVAVRNQLLHVLPEGDAPPREDIPRLALTALEAIEHLTLNAPAFDTASHGVDLALIADYISAIRKALETQT